MEGQDNHTWALTSKVRTSLSCFQFKMSEKIDLTGEQIVMGNRTEQLQLYQIFYYPPEKTEDEKRVDKTAVYFYLKEKDKEIKLARRSVYFAEIPQYRHFIINNIKAYFNWLDKRIKPAMPRSEYRKEMLIGLLEDIKEMMLDEWRNGKA